MKLIELMGLNWFDFLLLKSISPEKKSTKEIIADLKKTLPIYSSSKKNYSRSYFGHRLEHLVKLGLIVKHKSNANFYEAAPEIRSALLSYVLSVNNILEETNRMGEKK